MGLFEHWPYTNFHDLNLDWIIKKIPEVFTASAQAVQSAETAVSAKNDAVAAKDAAQLSAENAAASEESAGQSAESAQNYAEHIADPVGGLVTGWLDDNITPTTPPVDASLTVQGAAADAKKTGDEISDLKSQIATGGLKDSIKNALLQIASKVAYIDEDGQDYYDALYSAFYNVKVVSISAVFDNGGEYIFDTASLDDLKQYLTVTASYDNGTSGEVTGYTLSGSMVAGIQEITVSFSGKTATFNVTVYHNYANQSFTGWAAGTGVTKTASKITLKSTQANANSWKIWTADKSNTWGALKNKKLKARLTLYSPDWVGEQSDAAPLNKCSYEVAVYSGTNQTSINDRVVHYQYGGAGSFVPATEPTVYEIDFTATTDVSVTDAYRIGINLYNASANTVIITKAELIEVFEESET